MCKLSQLDLRHFIQKFNAKLSYCTEISSCHKMPTAISGAPSGSRREATEKATRPIGKSKSMCASVSQATNMNDVVTAFNHPDFNVCDLFIALS